MDKIQELREKIKGTEPTSLKKRLDTRDKVLQNLQNAKENLATSNTQENQDTVSSLQTDLESIEQIIVDQLDKIIKTQESSQEKPEKNPEEKTEKKPEENPEEKPKKKTGLVVFGILAAVGATAITILSLGKMNQK